MPADRRAPADFRERPGPRVKAGHWMRAGLQRRAAELVQADLPMRAAELVRADELRQGPREAARLVHPPAASTRLLKNEPALWHDWTAAAGDRQVG
jgi:hypothetical protein